MRQAELISKEIFTSYQNALEVGYVYLMANEHIPNILKIGLTRRLPEERAQELKSTGVPGRWVVIHSVFVPNCELLEKAVHHELSVYRVSADREFFSLPADSATETLNRLSSEIVSLFPGWPDLDAVENFIKSKRAEFKAEREVRIQLAHEQRQIRIVKLENERIKNERERILQAERKKEAELERVDRNTRQAINFQLIDGMCIVSIVCILVLLTQPMRVIIAFGWLPLGLLYHTIREKYKEREEAIKTRIKYGLPPI